MLELTKVIFYTVKVTKCLYRNKYSKLNLGGINYEEKKFGYPVSDDRFCFAFYLYSM